MSNTFGERLKAARLSKNIKVVDIAKHLEISERAYRNYENSDRDVGTVTLMKICYYLQVSSEYLLGISDNMEITKGRNEDETFTFTPHEKQLIIAYRDNKDMQLSVDRLLGIEKSRIKVYRAARSSDNHEPEIIELSAEQVLRIQNAEESDEDI